MGPCRILGLEMLGDEDVVCAGEDIAVKRRNVMARMRSLIPRIFDICI